MADPADKFIDQIQRQGLAVSLVVAACIAEYYMTLNYQREQLTLFKNHAALLREDNKALFNELLECLKK